FLLFRQTSVPAQGLTPVATVHSVDTGAPSPFSAACRVCQARLAHFTRAGNSHTPERTASFPSSCGSTLVLGSLVSILWTLSKSTSVSARVFPFTLVVINEAEALEIAQPAP